MACLTAALACLLYAAPVSASPAWLAPVSLSAPNRNASEAAVAMAAGGETVAVWQRQSEAGIGQVVQASVRLPGGAFAAPQELSASASAPALAMTPSGEAVAVWRRFEIENGGAYTIQASYRPPGGAFSAPLDVASVPLAALPREIHVAIDPQGDTVIVWTEEEMTDTWVVRGSLREAGGAFSAPVAVSPSPPAAGSAAEQPRVAIGAAGAVTAAWVHEEGGEATVEAASGTVASGFAAPQSLSASGHPATSPAVAIGSSGSATAVWAQSNGFTDVIEAASASTGGSFSAPREISDPVDSAFEPELAAGPGGAVTAVWTHSNGSDFQIEAATAAGGPGDGFGAPVAISEAGADATRPQVSEDPAGVTAIVWQRADGSEEAIQAAVGSAAGFGPPVEISGEGGEAGFPAVAVDAEGDATSVWRAAAGLVRAAGYDADAPRLAELSIPARGTVGVPASFSVAPFDVWPIASTTFQFGDGASSASTSPTHAYAAPGVYRVLVEARDAAGTATTAGGAVTVLPPNAFSIGRLSLDRRKGTGVLGLTVPWSGRVALTGDGVARRDVHAKGPGSVKLAIAARAGARRTLAMRGRARVKLRIEFTPSGGEGSLKRRGVTLIEKTGRG